MLKKYAILTHQPQWVMQKIVGKIHDKILFTCHENNQLRK